MVAGVPVNSTHPEYDAALPAWVRARDVLSGEDAVKAAGEKYLPRMDSQSEEEFGTYKARASFFGATSRTLEEYLDLVFRRAPALALGSGEGLKKFVADCDLWGLDFQRYARRVVSEVLAVGRAGSLVLWEKSGRPVVSLWKAEDIVDWAVERVGDRVSLCYLALREGERRRVFRMVDGVCFHESLRRQEDGSWSLVHSLALTRGETPLSFIPFVFHGPRHSRPEPDKLPLGEIIAANLDHYRLDADLKHGLHLAALPTAWVSGFDKAAPLRIGSSTAWVSDIPGASAGFLEFSGAGLQHIERAMERVEQRMALLGARMLEGTVVEGEAKPGQQRAELCGLGNVVASLNQSLTGVLQLAHWWVSGNEGAGIGFTMNTDLSARVLSAEGLTAVVTAWKAGAISRDTMLELLKRGEILPEGRTVAQERALIHGTK